MKELKLKKCLKCGSLIKVIEDCHCEECGIVCCNQEMKTIDANTTDASVEKHKPTYSVENDKLVVRVNHVMESEHYIEWISLETKQGNQRNHQRNHHRHFYYLIHLIL